MTNSSDNPVIQVEDLCRTYVMGGETLHALRDVSFTVEHGGYISIMGPSGSGKSTLLNVLGCLDGPTSGRYRLDGQDVTGLDDAALSVVRREHIGFVFQSFNLIGQISVLENIEVPLFYKGWTEKNSRERAAHLAELVGLADRLRHRPSELSGGQCQRVAVARALANDPRMILADEPTGNLDSGTSTEIMDLLDRLVQEGRTVILVTHDTEIGARAARTLHLLDGRLDREENRSG